MSAIAFQFDPDRVAQLEAAGWRAYYDRAWLRLLRLLVQLCGEQFHIPFPHALLAAYYATRASLAWAPLAHNTALVRAYYERFYVLAARYSGLHLDPVRTGALELRYNDDHRRLVGRPDKTPFIETMVALHSALFGLSADAARESAAARVQAATIVDGITGRTSTDVDGDWQRAEAALRRCYHSIYRALHGA